MKATAMNNLRSPRHQSGFTIVELMVGVLVGLIATVVMFQVFAVSEGQKRTTTGAGDAQQNGVASLFFLERDARMAGFSVNYKPALGCNVNAFHEPSNQPFTFTLSPYVIVDGGPTADTITFFIGDSRSFSSPAKLGKPTADSVEPFKVTNNYGYQLGDLFIATAAGSECTMYQVGSAAALGNNEVPRDPTNYVDAKGLARRTEFNRAGGVPPKLNYSTWAQGKGARLMNLGQKPTLVRYALDGTRLVAFNGLLPGGPFTVISENIVQFQAQYAWSLEASNAGGLTDDSITMPITAINTAVLQPGLGTQWTDSLPVNPTNAMYRGLIGVRMAIVARSATPEKPDAAGNCNTTTAFPQWLARGVDLDVSADPNWRCHRYRVFELTVPARNRLWMPNEDA